MSTTSSAPQTTATSFGDALAQGGNGQKNAGQSINSFLASVAGAAAVFALEFGLFMLIHQKFSRIYLPRTFLVPERERTKSPPRGLWQWLLPVFKTSNSDFIQKCGLDAYFFLRYLRTLLKIFIPMALLILPVLMPLNAVHGRGPQFATAIYDIKPYTGVTGLDIFAWGNVRPTKNNRYWVHLILAIVVIVYSCFVFFDELRSYIRLRQAYLTSPQHRLRASATTVLVTAIPAKWCTYEALEGLYDVFPGGIRNIWINRNFDELSDKVKWRNKLASALESAETAMIKNAKKVQMKRMLQEMKKEGKASRELTQQKLKAATDQGLAMAQTDGVSSGNPHQVRHTLDEALAESSGEPSRDQSPHRNKLVVPIPLIGPGIEAVGHGFETVGRTMLGGLRRVGKDMDQRTNATRRFDPEPSLPIQTIEGTHRRDNMEMDGMGFTPQSQGFDQDSHASHNGASDLREHSEDSTVRQSVSQDGISTHDQSNPERSGLGIEGASVNPNRSRDQSNLEILRNPERLGEAGKETVSKSSFWQRKGHTPFGIPSPTPHGQEEDEYPLSRPSPMTPGCNPQAVVNGKGAPMESETIQPQKKGKSQHSQHRSHYPVAYNEDYDPDAGKPKWNEYLKEKDRETMRLPIFGWHWMISLPLLGKKVDTIKYCRKEVARLNLEIEEDQKEPEKFPLMNSAFVQFNHQVAAHMACQAVSHHTPNQMAPRVVEISPDDVIWDNMSIKWWESYIRTGAVIALIGGLVIGWAFPVTFTGLLSNVTYLENVHWLRWIGKIGTTAQSIITGILPQLLLSLLLILLPIILRLLAKIQGDHTGMAVELSVQNYYFAFLFIQVFLVVSISSGITTVLPQLASEPTSIPQLLAQNLPKASNYFFSYLLLQAFSVSAGALVQVGGLIQWFVLAPLLDKTARQKWRRQTTLPDVQWGTFFPVYTNLACIGIIYSVISPLIMIFNIITFSLFWLAYRYNTLYVTKFRFDTGGLLYPRAINQLFTGLYLMQLCLIGLFLLVKDQTITAGKARPAGTPCFPQAIIMIIMFVLTLLFQYLLNSAFGPLLRYLPITLEDEAVMRDEEFARAQEKQWAMEDQEQDSSNDSYVKQGNKTQSPNKRVEVAENIEMQNVDTKKERSRLDPRNIGNVPEKLSNLVPIKASWADRSRHSLLLSPGQNANATSPRHRRRPIRKSPDVEAQRMGTNAMGEALFSGINDEIEDLTPEERDKLVKRAFQHEALRARRPVIWVPRDDLGISDDEISRIQKFSNNIWISNEHTGLDGKGRVIYRRSPPDFSEVDLIEL